MCTSCRTEFCTDQQNRKDYRDFYFRLGSPADPTSTREVAETTSGPTLPNRDYRPAGKVDSRLFPTSTVNPSLEIDRHSLSSLVTRTYVPLGQQRF